MFVGVQSFVSPDVFQPWVRLRGYKVRLGVPEKAVGGPKREPKASAQRAIGGSTCLHKGLRKGLHGGVLLGGTTFAKRKPPILLGFSLF